jgi:hypothetical protein
MIPAHLRPVDVTWIEPGDALDAYGNTVDDWDTPASSTAISVWLEQLDTREERDGRDTVVGLETIYTNELAVTPRARFVRGDVTYAVHGEPSVEYSPAGPHHVEVRVLRVEG